MGYEDVVRARADAARQRVMDAKTPMYVAAIKKTDRARLAGAGMDAEMDAATSAAEAADERMG